MSAHENFMWLPPRPVQVYRAGRYTQDDREFERDHVCDDLRVHLFSGPARMRIQQEEFEVQSGDLTVTPSGFAEQFAMTGSGFHWCLRIQQPAVLPEELGREPRIALARLYRLGHRSFEARARLEMIITDHRVGAGDQQHPSTHAANFAAHAFLCWLAGTTYASDLSTKSEQCVERVRKLLRSTECAGLPISEIANRAGMSQNRLEKAFFARYGETMIHYRKEYLIENAKWLLESTTMSIADIRRRLEIHDAQSFNRLFRRFTGSSPRLWRSRREPVMHSSPRPPVENAQ